MSSLSFVVQVNERDREIGRVYIYPSNHYKDTWVRRQKNNDSDLL
jgi:hypothetical protein